MPGWRPADGAGRSGSGPGHRWPVRGTSPSSCCSIGSVVNLPAALAAPCHGPCRGVHEQRAALNCLMILCFRPLWLTLACGAGLPGAQRFAYLVTADLRRGPLPGPAMRIATVSFRKACLALMGGSAWRCCRYWPRPSSPPALQPEQFGARWPCCWRCRNPLDLVLGIQAHISAAKEDAGRWCRWPCSSPWMVMAALHSPWPSQDGQR